MRLWTAGLSAVLALSLAAGCGDGARNMARDELNKYNMKSYNEGNARQLSRGATLNTALLQALKAECANRGIRLTHETYAEGLDGNISYSYFINGDARHFLLVHVYPSESDRVREIGEMYGAGDGRAKAAAANEASVIAQKGNTALVYASSGIQKSKYSEDVKSVFHSVLSGMNDRSAP
ncbi:hypothetical protein V3851_04655 [Paenibacillus sp. M1]|uniref:DUF4358 domain-containing protein n=1 Tax=Paenibacillus haidiansis TaxID=1574488 RepID=A0ABU7VQE0_9BACL